MCLSVAIVGQGGQPRATSGHLHKDVYKSISPKNNSSPTGEFVRLDKASVPKCSVK